jgi:hypothetical protein
MQRLHDHCACRCCFGVAFVSISCSSGDTSSPTASPSSSKPVLPQGIQFGDYTPGPTITDLPALAGADLFANPDEPLIDSNGRFSPDARRVLDVIELQLGLEGYRAAAGHYPPSLEDLIPAYAPLDDGTKWTAVPSDPESHAAYVYVPADSGASYALSAAMSSGKAYAVSNPSPVTAVNPDRGTSQEFVLSVGASRLAAGDTGYAPPVADQTGSQVEVDNSQGSHASSGKVINANPSSARVAVHNLHDFWTNVTLQAPGGCCVRLKPSPFNGGDIGGLYAQLGAIAPGGDAVWDGSFDPGSAQPILTTASVAGGSFTAPTLNILTFIAALVSKFPTANSIQTVVSAVQTAQNANDLIAAAQAIERADVPAFVRDFYGMLSDPNQRTLIRLALEQLAVPVSEGLLEKLTLTILIVELGQMAFDEVSAFVQGTVAGVVTFSASYPPVTQGPTPVKPSSAPATPYVPPVTPYIPPITPYVPPATPYVPPVTPYVLPVTPYVPPVTPYVPPVTPYVPPVTPYVPPPTPNPTPTPTPGAPPAAPSNVQDTQLNPPNGLSARLSWTDGATNESGFKIYKSTCDYYGGTGCGPYVYETTLSANTTHYDHQYFPVDIGLCYAVSAFNNYGESAKVPAVGCPAP